MLVYSTYPGGAGTDSSRSIAIDAERNVYVTGSTTSSNFPTANALQPDSAGGSGDVLVTKINAAGKAILYSTYKSERSLLFVISACRNNARLRDNK